MSYRLQKFPYLHLPQNAMIAPLIPYQSILSLRARCCLLSLIIHVNKLMTRADALLQAVKYNYIKTIVS